LKNLWLWECCFFVFLVDPENWNGTLQPERNPGTCCCFAKLGKLGDIPSHGNGAGG
jgi:hypothetical protein